ncbi:ATP-dependent DNA helicase RecQ [Bombilactobacillus bombi]|uniref:DEAD/DEAH box helicase n=1 Tax=Bombilactobacillus bombi TaxID=1303590 RepID=UPI000E569B68|nr:DEAD/DEAH box helicase [Bombilactobacillus bombi]AXX64250.1 ATP-dependent DNA helicase RecQ [Bombilactobacillus bombi]
MIKDKIEKIIKENGKSIIVLKGFDTSKLPSNNKYFSFNINNYDEVNLKIISNQVVDEIIDKRTFDDDYNWMTIEEYQLFKNQESINKMPIIVLENNLYDKQFPYMQTLSNIENIYQYLYYQEDNELEPEQKKLLENISFFYGKIDYSKQSGNYYVTYPEIRSDIKSYKYYEDIPVIVDYSKKSPKENAESIELSDDEIPFLDMEKRLLQDNNSSNIIFTFSGDPQTLPNNYLERLNILKKLTQAHFFFKTLSIKREVIANEQNYLKILNDVYGYNEFREIYFYKDIENHSKDTIKISQAQIIDDIVKQAEQAMDGEAFHDVYITASTGAGKSIMFQIPALYLAQKYKNDKPLTLVISPLIGLMNDQVNDMKNKGVYTSATINGNTPPFEKEKILEKVQSQEVDVLYLSPETLQARSNIKTIIGNRNIGVVIVDEAHIVTTWGKSFRADYWYLGIYLAKLRKEYSFPIVTFTATAIYGGKEDMYLDTRNSLNMISPISYFGKVRRDDILMNVQSSDKYLNVEGRDYRKTKNALALKHLKYATKNKQKSLLYFPTVKLLIDFYNFIDLNEPAIAQKTGKYYGTLQKEEKDEVLSKYKTGELQFVLATKAFGMGIDIPDITNVYHYAPTGSVVDYIQEIGRAAREKDKIPYGFGMIDFLSKDMNEVKQLHGMSAIRKSQIIEVMRKVLSIYKEKGNNRNLIISPEDFKYIFVQNKQDENSLDNKVKTVLLMIEKDFSSPNKLGYSPFVARPRSVFGNDLIFVTSELEEKFIKSRLERYFYKKFDLTSKTYSAVYQVNLSGIWEKYYKRMSFPSFKFALFNQEERDKLQHKNLFEKFIYASGVETILNNNNSIDNILSQYHIILDSFENFVNDKKITGNEFTIIELGNYFMRSLKISDKFEARAFAQTIVNSAFEFGKIKEMKFISERPNSNVDKPKYKIYQDCDIFTKFIIRTITSILKPTDNYLQKSDEIFTFYFRSHGDDIDARIAALGIGEARKLLNYQVIGGNNPQIYLRMNSIYPLEKAIKQGDFYQNSILQDVQNKHYTSVEMLKYLFTKKQSETTPKERILNYSNWFWDVIEDYFMGILPNKVKYNLSDRIKS